MHREFVSLNNTQSSAMNKNETETSTQVAGFCCHDVGISPVNRAVPQGHLCLGTMCRRVGSKSHCRAVPAVPCPILCASNLIFIISSKLAYEVKNCNDIMFLC